MIAVIVNPRSRANRRDPRIAAEFQAIVGEHGRVFAPKSLEELDAAAAELRRAPPTVLAVHGGDGTLHKTVTALDRAFGASPIPPIAVLCGGTMNVVATSLAIRERPAVFLRAIVDAVREGRSLDTIRRRCLRIGDELGFLFGSGLPANFLTEYYAPGGYGPGRAAWLLARAFLSALWHGPFVRKLFKRFEGSVRVDGALLERTAFVGLMAGTVREVGLGSASWPCTRRCCRWPSISGRCSAGAESRPVGRSAPSLRRWTFIRRTAPWLTRSTATSTRPTSRSRSPSARRSCFSGRPPR